MSETNTETEKVSKPHLVLMDPEQLWWICWRIDGDLCARSLAPAKTALAVDAAGKVGKVWGEENVWLEKAEEHTA